MLPPLFFIRPLLLLLLQLRRLLLLLLPLALGLRLPLAKAPVRVTTAPVAALGPLLLIVHVQEDPGQTCLTI